MKLILPALLALTGAVSAHAQAPPGLEVQRNGASPSQIGPAARFTGAVRVDTPFAGRGDARVSGAVVTFEPGARTAWHTHPLGQTLIVTNGCGLAQTEGAPAQSIRPGDVAWIPAGVRHWHGASPTTTMSHVAIVESLNGSGVQWMELVPDDQYRAGASAAPCTPPST